MELGPATMVTGFLTKRTRNMNRWKRRWWQLMDNGTLLYFKSDDRLKLLGEIDIARTCYDVRLGADSCKMAFPRGISTCCCFAFSVLKRTYYMYAPTAGETKRWVECIKSVSLVLNQTQLARAHRPSPRPAPSPPRASPTSRSNEERRHSIDNSHTNRDPVHRSKLRRRSAIVQSDWYRRELQDEPSELPVFSTRRLAHRHTSSVPNLYVRNYQAAPPTSHGGSSTQPNSRLWLDGSPHTSHGSSPAVRGHHPTTSPTHTHAHTTVISPLAMRSRQGMSSSGNELDKLHLHKNVPSDSGSRGGTLPRVRQGKRASLPSAFDQEYLQLQVPPREPQTQRRYERTVVRPRSASMSDYSSSLFQGKNYHHGGYHSLGRVRGLIQHYSNPEVLGNPQRSWRGAPPPVKPKPILRAPKGSHRKEPSFVAATRISSGSEATATAAIMKPPSHPPPPPPPPPPPLPQTNVNGPPSPLPSFPSKQLGGPPNFIPPPPPSSIGSTSSGSGSPLPHYNIECGPLESPRSIDSSGIMSLSSTDFTQPTNPFWGQEGNTSGTQDGNNLAYNQLQKVC